MTEDLQTSDPGRDNPIWVAATAAPNSAGVAEIADALTTVGLASTDLVHVKVWVPAQVERTSVISKWLEAFPDPHRRPSLSLIATQGAHNVGVTGIAVAEGDFRNVYAESVRSSREVVDRFPDAAACGDFFSVGALGGTDGQTDPNDDPQLQADEAFARLGALLDALGVRSDGVGHMFVWYRDHDVREIVNAPCLSMFPTPGDRPARHSLVRPLPNGQALQIEAMGSRSQRRCSYTISGTFHGGIGGVPNSLPFGVKCGEVLYSAGTYGRDPISGVIPDSLEEQAPSAVEHSLSLLDGAGMDASCVRHAYIWLRDRPNDHQVEELVRKELLNSSPDVPLQVVYSPLPGNNQVQIELVAVRDKRGGQHRGG